MNRQREAQMRKKTKIKLIALTAVLLMLTAVTLAAMTTRNAQGAIDDPVIEPRAYLPVVVKPHRDVWGTPQPCVVYPDGSEACP